MTRQELGRNCKKLINRDFVVIMFGIMWLGSCQHTPPALTEISKPISQKFSTCDKSEGSFDFSLYRHENLMAEAVMDWVFTKDAKLSTEITDPIGGSLVGIELEGKKIRSYGSASHKLPELLINEKDDFIYIDGHFSGLKRNDLGCLLDFKLPQYWQPFLYSVEHTKEKDFAVFKEPKRNISIFAQTIEDDEIICIEFSWSQLLGLIRNQLEWCMIFGERNRAKILLPSSYQLFLVRSHA